MILSQIKAIYQEIEKLLGSMKFAVVIILLFASVLIFGTFQESYHGTEYANRFVYKSVPFILLQFLMFLSILCATLARLPFRYNLRGFYLLHLGLLTLFFGSFVTYHKGLDGTLTLYPNASQNLLTLKTDQIVIVDKANGQQAELDLKYAAHATDVQLTWEHFTVLRYLPFAGKELQWVKNQHPSLSAQYHLKNAMFSENITLSLDEQSDFRASQQLGPLSVHLLPAEMFHCFTEYPKDRYLLWNTENFQCLSPSHPSVKLQKKPTLALTFFDPKQKINLSFKPELSPLPFKGNQILDNSPWRLFNRSLFEKKPHLIYFGRALAFYDKNLAQWVQQELKDDWFSLPWMGFETQIARVENDLVPVMTNVYQLPIQDNNELIAGKDQAVEMEVRGATGTKTFWLNMDQTINIQLEGKSFDVTLQKKQQPLPLDLRLSRFVMKTDPGTQNPASYESFVTVAPHKGEISQHHLYMNHPLKYEQLTFYQASYFKTDDGDYGSVLSVNYDPGRWIKYLGSFLLVFGAIWHFAFIRRKEQPS